MEIIIWNQVVAFFLALVGLVFLCWRMGPILFTKKFSPSKKYTDNADAPRVSVIVPCRNEEHNLGILLPTLMKLNYPNYEIIIVDDQSTDSTIKVAQKFDAIVVEGASTPAGWNGKQWACQQGALQATGDYLLFTDADTFHSKDGLGAAVSYMQDENLDLLSALPNHRCEAVWEKLMGPFHVLLLMVTSPFSLPKPSRLFAIGQYLLFSRLAYAQCNGHEIVKDAIVEDVPIAQKLCELGKKYRVFPCSGLFGVRMYSSFGDFIRGWRRNFRAGFRYGSSFSAIEVTAVFALATAGGFELLGWLGLVLVLSMVVIIAMMQKKLGNFSMIGAILYPFSLMVFIAVSFLAFYDLVFNNQVRWKGRKIEASAEA